MSTIILGISAYYHDSAATLIIDDEIIAAAQEERFTRKKHDSSFPLNAIKYVINEAGISTQDLSAVSFYDKPYIKFERLLETYHAFAPRGLKSFIAAIPVWIKEKLFMKKMLSDELSKLGISKIPILFPEHHLSHAASAFYPSPYNESAILTIDGVGEWATTVIGFGKGNKIEIFKELHFPHSVGLLYSAFTYYCGFKVNSGEYKLMGLAPYGIADSAQKQNFKKLILDKLVDIREDGSILLNMNYFQFATGLKMTYDSKFERLFGIPPRKEESEISQSYMNLALAIQEITEEIVIKLAVTTKELTNSENLVLAGGVALNSVANGKLLKSGIFKNIWVQPAAGDAGGSLGAAYLGYYTWKGKERKISNNKPDAMKGSYLGPSFEYNEIMSVIRRYNAKYKYYSEFEEVVKEIAKKIVDGKVVGWFQGRMEFGPRALGNRSILGDARNPEMQKKLNLKIKKREGFRPFAPSVLEEDIDEYFEINTPSPYMLFVVDVKGNRLIHSKSNSKSLNLFDRLYWKRSDIPAVTHIDNSARLQSVNAETNPKYWKLINEFKNQTDYSLIINTSFNVRGEPIVCTPEDAYKCFMNTEMDYLGIENFIFDKKDQIDLRNKSNIDQNFEID